MIAQAIGKDKSVVSRELKRNRNEKGKYRFSYAQNMAEIRKERSRQPRKLKLGLKKADSQAFTATMVSTADRRKT